MAYDANKDRVLSVIGEVQGGKAGTIRVQVVAYDGGTAKIAMLRVTHRASDGAEFVKDAGRLLPEEVEAVIPLLQEAAQYAKAEG